MQNNLITIDNLEHKAILSTKCSDVNALTQDVIDQVFCLKNTLSELGGAGLAAPQIGITNRIMVCSFARDNNIQEMINPSYVPLSHDTICSWEGCYSIPLQAAKINRWAKIKVTYSTLKEEAVISELSGESACIFQHEYDHLEGIVMISKALLIKKFSSQEQYRKFLFANNLEMID